MIKINPISNEDDLKNEMDFPRSQKTPMNIDPSNDQKSNNIETATEHQSQEPKIIRAESYRQISDSDKVIETIEKGKKPFSYSSPASGYVLIWLHLLAIAITSVFFLHFVISYTNHNSVGNDFMIFLKSSDFNNMVLPCALIILYCIVIISFISGSRKILRYFGIVLSAAATGFQIYLIVRLYGEFKNFQAIISTLLPNLIIFYVAYLPYLFLPLMSLVFFLMPNTSKAYR